MNIAKTPEQLRQELEERVAALKARPVDPETAATVNLRENVANQMFEIMQAQGITKAELARRLETSPAYISKLLGGGGSNLTLESLARLGVALGVRVSVRLGEPERAQAEPCWDDWSMGKLSGPPLKKVVGGLPPRSSLPPALPKFNELHDESHSAGADEANWPRLRKAQV